MPDPTLLEIMEALADQIRGELAGTADPLIDGLQVEAMLTLNPTPPSIDIYPADPFQTALGFGAGNNELFLTVRARVNTPDHDGAQELLLSMMDQRAETSMAQAILSDRTLSSKVTNLNVSEGPSNYGIFPAVLPEPGVGAFLGCTWTVEVIP